MWSVYSDPDKHYLMDEHERVPIAVCEREPSSIIAFALRWKLPPLAVSVLLHKSEVASGCSFINVLLYNGIIVSFSSSCKKYKTALDDLAKASNTGGDENSQVVRYARFLLKSDTEN